MKRCRECSAVENDEVEACLACGGRAWVAEPPMVIDDRYEVERKIGRGTMGIVYRARDVGLGREVALKVIAPMYARDPGMVERFRREARALATIRHENVVQVYAAGSHGRSLYFAMEFVAGLPLDAILAQYEEHGETPPVGRAITVLSRIGMGLAAAHEKGLVHRDVKPGNILVEQDTGRPIVIDFGLVHQPRPGSDAKTMRSGTPSYMAPEQSRDVVLDSDAISPRTDVYALGCTAFEVLTGTPPFTARDMREVWQQHLSAPPPALSSLRPELEPLDVPLGRALQKDPAARYPNGEGFARALEKAAANLLLRPSAVAMPRQVARPATSSLAGALLRILLVDDDAGRLARLTNAVKAAAGEMATTLDVARSAAEATVEITKWPDVIVMNADVLGPVALDLLTWLRDQPDGGSVRVVVTSNQERARWRYDLFGVRDVLFASSDQDALTHALKSIGESMGWAR
jgi:serine/threonine-protein kinase